MLMVFDLVPLFAVLLSTSEAVESIFFLLSATEGDEVDESVDDEEEQEARIVIGLVCMDSLSSHLVVAR
jgi:hypothetical protein